MNAAGETETALLVRMPARLHNAVKATATREDRTMASVVREAVREYIRRSERKSR
jgi:predicted DNA-binding protein